MKNILLIGVGRFGRHIAMHLNQLGHQVMAVDRNEERIDAVMPRTCCRKIHPKISKKSRCITC